MKKLVVILLVLACSVGLVMAQSSSEKSVSKFTLGAFGGLNIPDLTGGGGNPLSTGWSSRTGAAFGLTFELKTGTHFAWQADVLYSSEGGQRNGMQAYMANHDQTTQSVMPYFYANIKNASELNYLEIPVMGKFLIPVTKTSNFYVDFGPYVGILLNAKQITSGQSPVYGDMAGTIPISSSQNFDANTDITNQINTVNFGLTGGIGFSQGVGFGSVFLDFRGAYGLTTIQNNSQNGDNHTGNLCISLGYSIPL